MQAPCPRPLDLTAAGLLCRNQGNELDKVRRMLNASDSELRSSRKQLSALEEKSRYTRMDLLRLVGDMHSVKSSKVGSLGILDFCYAYKEGVGGGVYMKT